ncbi:MAG: hypothetical protein ACLPPF_15885, partial [Rhodomicrobium sp.]
EIGATSAKLDWIRVTSLACMNVLALGFEQTLALPVHALAAAGVGWHRKGSPPRPGYVPSEARVTIEPARRRTLSMNAGPDEAICVPQCDQSATR